MAIARYVGFYNPPVGSFFIIDAIPMRRRTIPETNYGTEREARKRLPFIQYIILIYN